MKTTVSILILSLSICVNAFSQIIINKGIYKANFSNTLHVPRYVSYYLNYSGHKCDRSKEGFNFTNDIDTLLCATDDDYSKNPNGYQKGHLANAEDFASDCTEEELTFRYYNCLPQLEKLNGGIWRTNEAKIRTWSQKEKLYIICGGYFQNLKMKEVAVPSYCWKVVQSVATKKVLFCGWFSNSLPVKLEEIPVAELEKRLKANIVLLK